MILAAPPFCSLPFMFLSPSCLLFLFSALLRLPVSSLLHPFYCSLFLPSFLPLGYTPPAPSPHTDLSSPLPRVGMYPLAAYAPPAPPPISQVRAASPDTIESVHSDTPEPSEREGRKVVTMMCEVKSDPALDASLTVRGGGEGGMGK